ncbi:transposase family protein [Streptomyces sp. NPDC017179]|uniref:transposase family protein n=1 Tax=Streptomyces sp. NPDC017179 TaxID=3364979 RepID=UPI0037AC2594
MLVKLGPLDAGRVADLRPYFDSVPDPRSRRGRWYSLTAILLVCACAVVSGARSIDELAEWGQRASNALLTSRPRSDRTEHGCRRRAFRSNAATLRAAGLRIGFPPRLKAGIPSEEEGWRPGPGRRSPGREPRRRGVRSGCAGFGCCR